MDEKELAQIKARAERAHNEIAEICAQGRDRWRMRIPAQPDHDSDLILSASITDAETLLAEVERLKAERQRAIDALDKPGRDAVATTGDLEDGINMDSACRSYEQPETVQRQEINRLKDGMVALIRAWRAHDDDTGDYSRCADEIEGLLNGGALC